MTTTIAETVAERLDNDGYEYWAERLSGEPVTDPDRTAQIDLDDLCRHLGARVIRRDGWGIRYVFPDGSAIIDAGSAWDIALSPDCWCWQGAGHGDECTARSSDLGD